MDNLTQVSANAQEDSSTAQIVIQSVLYSVLLIFGIISNTLIIYLVRTYKSLQSVTNLWVSSLCFVQLLISSISLPIALLSTIADDWIFGKNFCQICAYFTFTCRSTTIFSIGAIALDRYHVISRPFNKRMKKKKAKAFILLSWWMALLVCSPPLFGIGSFKYSSSLHLCFVSWSLGGSSLVYTSFHITAVFIATLLTTIWSYTLVYKFTKIHATKKKKKTTITRSYSENHLAIPRNKYHNSNCSGKKKERVKTVALPFSYPASNNPPPHTKPRMDQQTMHIIIILLLVFVCCWTPYYTYALHSAANGYARRPYSAGTRWSEFFITWLSFCTCVCDPLLYGVYTRNFRDHLKKHFNFWKKESKQTSNGSQEAKKSLKTSSTSAKLHQKSFRHIPLPKVTLDPSQNDEKLKVKTSKQRDYFNVSSNAKHDESECRNRKNKVKSATYRSTDNNGFVEEIDPDDPARSFSNDQRNFKTFSAKTLNGTNFSEILQMRNENAKSSSLQTSNSRFKSVKVMSGLPLLSTSDQQKPNGRKTSNVQYDLAHHGVYLEV